MCPVVAVLSYLALHGGAPEPLFIDTSHRPVSKAKFVIRIWGILDKAGYLSHQCAGHSFRINAATEAARAGLKDLVIQALGWWHSATFMKNIRTPPEQLVSISARPASESPYM